MYLDKGVRGVLAVHVSDLEHGKPGLHLSRAGMEGRQSEAQGVWRCGCAMRAGATRRWITLTKKTKIAPRLMSGWGGGGCVGEWQGECAPWRFPRLRANEPHGCERDARCCHRLSETPAVAIASLGRYRCTTVGQQQQKPPLRFKERHRVHSPEPHGVKVILEANHGGIRVDHAIVGETELTWGLHGVHGGKGQGRVWSDKKGNYSQATPCTF